MAARPGRTGTSLGPRVWPWAGSVGRVWPYAPGQYLHTPRMGPELRAPAQLKFQPQLPGQAGPQGLIVLSCSTRQEGLSSSHPLPQWQQTPP